MSKSASSARVFSLLLLLGLAACVSPAPRLEPGGIGTIAAKETSGLSDEEARRAVLARAASLTVDHGYRYFVMLPPAANPPGTARTNAMAAIRAGQPQRFQILRRATSARAGQQVWDAYRLLTRKSEAR